MKTVPDDFVAEMVKLSQDSPFLLLVEIDVSATQRLRITPYLQSVTWPSGGGDTYYPFPLLFDSFKESAEDESATTTVTIPNADGQIIPYLIANRGLMDKAVIAHFVNKATLDETVALRWDYEVAHAAANVSVITFGLGTPEMYEHTAPSQRFSRWHCNWTFGDPHTCMYDTSRPGAFQTCPKSWQACIERGDEEESAGVKRLHPRRTRIFPGIPLVG